jgi:intein/homing endonuclease
VPLLPSEIFSPYVAGLFDAEGCIHFKKRRTRKVLDRIEIYSANITSLLTLKELLHRQGICSDISYRGDSEGVKEKSQYVLMICGRKNLMAFIQGIQSYCNSTKSRLLNCDCLPSTKMGRPHE